MPDDDYNDDDNDEVDDSDDDDADNLSSQTISNLRCLDTWQSAKTLKFWDLNEKDCV